MKQHAGKENEEVKKIINVTARWPGLMSIEDTGEYLGISPKTIRNGLAKNAPSPFPIRPARYGKRVLFARKDLDEYIDSLPRG